MTDGLTVEGLAEAVTIFGLFVEVAGFSVSSGSGRDLNEKRSIKIMKEQIPTVFL